MNPVLRPYQEAALIAGRQHILDGRRRIVLCCPTGSGKTLVAASIIHSARQNFNAKVLFVAHRLELIDQCVAQLERWGVTEVGVIRADDRRYAPLMPVQVASVATLARRDIEWFQPTIVFVDECHRAAADSYTTNVFEAYPDAIHFGLSATPIRADGKTLGRKFGGPYDALEIVATYADLIADKFIAEPRCFSTPVKPDLSRVHTIGGDYNQEELEEAVLEGGLVGKIVDHWQELSDGRQTVVFAVSIKHSQAIVEKFLAAGVHAAHLDGETPLSLRRDILSRLISGDLQVVSNVGVLEEGWDAPSVKCGILARPTKSLRLYMQQAGRLLRPWNGVVPLILDHAGNFDRHGAPHEDRIWSLDTPPSNATRSEFKVCPDCFAYVKSGTKICPHCNHIFGAEEETQPPAESSVHLQERELAIDPKRRDFDKWVNEARKKGYKSTWASVQFKEKYGCWPPWGWSQHAKAMFEADLQWQNKLAHNETWRARRKADEETSPEDKLMVLADEVFKGWDS